MNCYVLTGGRSRRMGRSKASLFLDRIMNAARPVFDEVIVVDHTESETHAAIFGVVWALRAAAAPCFILAVDYPLITSDLLRFVIERNAVPMWNGVPQLLCAVWDSALLPEIERRIAAGCLDLRGLIEHAIIPESELRARFSGEPLMNVNTPAELEAAERLYG